MSELTVDSTPAEHAAVVEKVIADSLADPHADPTATPEQRENLAGYARYLFGLD